MITNGHERRCFRKRSERKRVQEEQRRNKSKEKARKWKKQGKSKEEIKVNDKCVKEKMIHICL